MYIEKKTDIPNDEKKVVFKKLKIIFSINFGMQRGRSLVLVLAL